MRLLLSIGAFIVFSIGWLHWVDYMPLVRATVASGIGEMGYQNTLAEDDFKLLFCGTGSPTRTSDRASPCLALVANGKLFVFDAGEGAIAKLHEYRAPVLKLNAVFLTHLHSDHMSGIPELLHNTWLYGRTKPVSLIGPPGTTKFLDAIRSAYDDDVKERMHVLGPDGVEESIAFSGSVDVAVEDRIAQLVFQDGDLTIEAFRVDHPDWNYAYGYRIRKDGRTIVISGDTAVSDGVERHSQDADILIHEAMNESLMSVIGKELTKAGSPIPPERLQRIAAVHTPTLALADLAEAARVKTLVLTHLIPPVPNNFVARQAFTSGMGSRYHGEILVANDGRWIDLRER